MTRRLLGVLAAATAFGMAGNAVTLVATTDEPMSGYLPGATVTITLTGTTNPMLEQSENIDVRIVGTGFAGVSADTALGGACFSAAGCVPGAPWSLGGTQGSTVGGNFVVFSQIGGLSPTPNTLHMTPPLPGLPFYTGDSTLTAVFTTVAVPGTHDIELAGVGVGFFGISGPQNLGSYTVVPEPTTAALIALGLLGLTAVGRR